MVTPACFSAEFMGVKVLFTFPISPTPKRSSSASSALRGKEGSLTKSSCKKTTRCTTWVTFFRMPHTEKIYFVRLTSVWC